jgi:predicted GIY-YIG superfamily endonuclease
MTEKDPMKRLAEHNSKSNKWTKGNGPFKLVYYEKYFCKKDAL